MHYLICISFLQDDDELDPEDVVIDERTETGSKSIKSSMQLTILRSNYILKLQVPLFNKL